ncbi:MAG TPA: polysaccharide biosynthesis/export family protein [Verrucomicrobiales bacterium]|nr:polysaccharide biosynthesis/export family protein [Verrucomicrobiales bacterium]
MKTHALRLPARGFLAAFALFAAAFALLAQDAYRIGPGDRLSIRVVGRADGARSTVPVAPDGTISFLQASGIPVAGLTIPEARQRIEEKLRQYEKNLKLTLSPAGLGSKSFTVLGQVARSGAYPLTRRVTVLEAIATSGGLAKESPEGANRGTRADLSRSFIVRRGRRLSVDFSRLYFEGDMTQNVALQPDDYIYIASNLDTEFYVFGAVTNSGLQRLTPALSVTGAITRQGGFAPGAWKKRVLLVRGSTVAPETFVVQVDEILRGQLPDVPVQAGDILYVHTRPWHRAEDILGNAFTAFVQAMALAAVDDAASDF